MRITAHYKIPKPVPFVDVHVERDNLLFLDPSAIRNSSGSLARRAQVLLEDFFEEVVRCRTSSSPVDQAKGLRLLQQLHEPNETRLGMSAVGVSGHALGDGLAERLWDELATNPACRVAAVKRLEDVKLFIEGVGDDLTSDLTTRVTYSVLADFTKKMMARYPSLARRTVHIDAQVWDPTGRRWRLQAIDLPDAPLHPLLLVPKDWIYWRMLMDPEAFYNRHATRTVQEERTRYDPEGKPLRPAKKQLRQEFPEHKPLNARQTAKRLREGENLVSRYRAEVDAEYEPLDDDEIARRTEDT